MKDLRKRARAFMEQPVPAEINYAPGNLTDSFIARYAQGGPFDDPEMIELLHLCFYTAETAAKDYFSETKIYFSESAEILKGIIIELTGKAPEPIEE